MKVLQKFITAFIAIFIVAISIIQFHHHDSDGSICMYMNHGNIEATHQHHHEVESTCSHNTFSCESHSCNEHEYDCGIKLSQVSSSKKFSLEEHSFSFIVLYNLLSEYLGVNSEKNTTYGNIYVSEPLSHSYYHFGGLRAPPAIS